ncbi:DUF7126 family protein [Salinilacihabitans rarus]|uniref:DUF7126 family protein n=1 Tax=Salinilacihabitans rarus TaxID=2961596 RepID=UPI0020C83922|nr:CTP synthetase [Salinilacihabitans rarus]
MRAIVAGPDEDGIADALADEGVDVTRIEGVASRPVLEEAGVLEADLYVLTDVSQATSIPIAIDLNDDLRTVVYDRDTIPEFVRGQLDLSVDPRLVDASVVAEELTD